MHNVYPRSKRTASMFYSVPLTIAADAILFELGVRQLATQIPFEGVAQHDAVRTLQH
jgi:mRNA-degrading endonuclease toxin of MazEF toxin-antitoxin module